METFYFNAVTVLEKKKTVINGTRTGGGRLLSALKCLLFTHGNILYYYGLLYEETCDEYLPYLPISSVFAVIVPDYGPCQLCKYR